MYLFAYASLMSVNEIKKLAPSAKRVTIARLPGYVFTFTLSADDLSTKANMLASTDADAVVWGVLYEIADIEHENLQISNAEVTLIPVTVFDEQGANYKAEAFTAKPHAVNNFLLPYNWYLNQIVDTARQAGLPDIYVNALSRLDSKADNSDSGQSKQIDKA